MDGSGRVGLVLVGVGALIAVVGLAVWAGGFAWFGRLPGDLRIERDSFRLFVPITSMALVSLALTVVVHLLLRLFGGGR